MTSTCASGTFTILNYINTSDWLHFCYLKFNLKKKKTLKGLNILKQIQLYETQFECYKVFGCNVNSHLRSQYFFYSNVNLEMFYEWTVTHSRLPNQYQVIVGWQPALPGPPLAVCNDSNWIQVSPWTWTLHKEEVDQYQSHEPSHSIVHLILSKWYTDLWQRKRKNQDKWEEVLLTLYRDTMSIMYM